MDKETFAVFEKFFNTPIIKVDYEYRLYYNEVTGEPLFYSMENHPEGSFIIVTHTQYTEGRYDLLIRNGMIEKLIDSTNWSKLVPSKEGVSTRQDNVMIVDQDGPAKWMLKTYYQD